EVACFSVTYLASHWALRTLESVLHARLPPIIPIFMDYAIVSLFAFFIVAGVTVAVVRAGSELAGEIARRKRIAESERVAARPEADEDPSAFFEQFGTWDDDRSTEEIIREIYSNSARSPYTPEHPL